MNTEIFSCEDLESTGTKALSLLLVIVGGALEGRVHISFKTILESNKLVKQSIIGRWENCDYKKVLMVIRKMNMIFNK